MKTFDEPEAMTHVSQPLIHPSICPSISSSWNCSVRRFVQNEIKMKGILKSFWLDTNNQVSYLILTHVIALHVGGRYDSKYVFEKDSSTRSGSIQINKNTGLSKSKSTFNRKSITHSTKLLYVPDTDFIL